MDVISFSGDKLLGGPQAGIIAGRAEYVERIRKNQLTRALRVDKMTLAALEATLRLYLDPELARSRVPTLNMITASAGDLRRKARTLRARLTKTLDGLARVGTRPGMSRVGGGSFPEQDLPTTLVTVRAENISAEKLRQRLLAVEIPVVGRVEDDCFCLDPRTLAVEEFPLAAENLHAALSCQIVNTNGGPA